MIFGEWILFIGGWIFWRLGCFARDGLHLFIGFSYNLRVFINLISFMV
jgi:hypothetical protein